MPFSRRGWLHECFSCRTKFKSDELDEKCPVCSSRTSRNSPSLDPDYQNAFGVLPLASWLEVQALTGLALYTYQELEELFRVYSERSDRADFRTFVESRFVKHPYYREPRYIWKMDYNQAMERLGKKTN